MQTYTDLVELARICLKQAREAKSAFVSDELTRVAKGYQVRAATMNQGRFPDIGDEGRILAARARRSTLPAIPDFWPEIVGAA